ncbi:coproporphyrinogen dehydrogenase HemZ [Feifania hominis]|uniref:Coproporphyrinogen dehydrogenase HemZ n=1 Tax=Feifania hominis TaxID=2763660 RepID=A0A926HUX7_9FIRM|nr:coproporphyrinogen dehydrogenase HemZ [Feifania hominis]MBC8536763.1 coproporphyrinogen dehydrogenase HemZ [Feifania hominis]
MKITIVGHEERYLIECLSLLFLPGCSFRDDADGRSAVSRVTLDGERAAIHSSITADGRTAADETVERLAPDDGALARAVARSFYRAGQRLTGLKPPWGTLIGIRPAKKVAALLRGGLTPDGAADYLAREYLTEPGKTALCLAALEEEREALRVLPAHSASLYIGIPFCPSRCSYCSFVSHSIEKARRLLPGYLELLGQEIAATADAARRAGLTVNTVYIGGGTPTVLDADQLDTLMARVGDCFPAGSLAEYTVEAGRPDTITPEKLAVIRARGANRVSINPQTMDDGTLAAIGRTHTAADIERAYREACAVGFDAVNMDMIAGLPGESAESFCRSVDRVLALAPENVTVHTLSLKRAANLRAMGTDIFRGENEKVSAMLAYSQQALARAGYHPYYLYRQKNTIGNNENIGFCRDGRASLYNIYIMGEFQTILSCGAGGVTKFVFDGGERIERIFNPKYPYEYRDRFSQILQEKEKIVSAFSR